MGNLTLAVAAEGRHLAVLLQQEVGFFLGGSEPAQKLIIWLKSQVRVGLIEGYRAIQTGTSVLRMLDLVLVGLSAIDFILRGLCPARWIRWRNGMDVSRGCGRWKQSMPGLSLIMCVYSVVAFARRLLVIYGLRREGNNRRLVLHKHVAIWRACVLA